VTATETLGGGAAAAAAVDVDVDAGAVFLNSALHSRVADARSWRRERARSAAAEASAACFSSLDLSAAMSRAGV